MKSKIKENIDNKSDSKKNIDTDDEKHVKLLIEEIKGGNKNAFTELVNLYHAQVASLAFKMVNDYDEAADIAQNVFVFT